MKTQLNKKANHEIEFKINMSLNDLIIAIKNLDSDDRELSKQYTVDFYAKTEPKATRTIGVKFEQLETWTGPATTVTLNDEWQQIVFSPIMSMKSPPSVVIHIQFNKLKEDVWFSHFRVYEGKFVEEKLGTPKIAVNPMGSLSISWGKIKGF